MAARYSELIRTYCIANGIEIPVGFDRRSASRYAVFVLMTPPKLVARTWFKQHDVVYYLAHCSDSLPKRVLDFKDGIELLFVEGKRLKRGEPFAGSKSQASGA